MDLSLERDSSGLGSLFQQIINDMKNTSPLWEDFVAKANKLHACLRAAIQAISSYLDAFQKIADAATNSRGASKEIGTALTRVCLRHKAVETRLKTFTAAIMDCLVQPLQEKLEDWKRTVASIDKEHAKEYKRCRTELKKRSTDTLRLQKKARKGQTDTIQSLMDSHMQDVTLRRAELEEVEKKSLRSAMVEERLRYCTFVHMLQPVVREECEVMSELGHLQEAMESIANVTKDPNILPQASEELIHDAKATMTLYPESPVGGSGSAGGCSNSLGSRKSSVCSISSMNSSGSSSSPGHHHYPRSISQLISPAIRLKPGESSDSGFCSSPALTLQASNATSQSHAVATWPPHCQDPNATPAAVDRPHTISTAYEKGHARPQLTVYTFQNPDTILEGVGSNGACNESMGNLSGQTTPVTQKPPINVLNRPPLPVRCSSLERPLSSNNNRNGGNLMQRQCPSPIPAHITKELSMHHAQQQQQQQQQQTIYQQHQQQPQQQQQLPHTHQPQQSPPTYVNMSELAHMAAAKASIQQQQQQQNPILQQQQSIDSVSSQHSTDSTSIASNTQSNQQQSNHNTITNYNAPLTRSVSSSNSSNTPSLHSHPSIESTVATSLVGQTTTPSSGSSTPQNHYSPLLTNSPSSTAAGTPSGGSMTSGMTTGFVYNVSSPTPPPSANTTSTASDALKITEVDNAQNANSNIERNANAPTSQSNNANDNSIENVNSTTDTDWSTNSVAETDVRSRASVLQKASMFEKQAAAAAANTPARAAAIDTGIYGIRRAEDNNRFVEMQPEPHEPSSELSDVGNATTRIARRSSINTAKPPPPVRRSSSVTPTPKAGNGTFRTSSPGIYAQPKAVNNMSSFRSASPGPTTITAQPKTNPNLIAQLNARLSKQQKPEGIYGSTPSSPVHQNNHAQSSNELVYMRNYAQQQSQQQQQQQQTQHYTDGYASVSIEKTGSIRAKTKAEFLENLNSKLAKQNMSGRAFAVRSLINSKALPDPRICHESLMDQIKRGATLKRNQKINDRSAPKIH